MKKVYLLGALSGLLLASCANDDLVVKPVAPTSDSQAAITFAGRLGNMSRATQLEDVMDNFGVWAIKADADGDLNGVNLGTDAKVVMPDYMVGHQTSSSYSSDWSYVMDSPKQYLKYWDGAFAKTYFFAYGPHNSKLGTDKVSLAIAGNKATMTFPEYEMGDDEKMSFIYADARVETNADHIAANAANTTTDPKKVPLSFHRLLSQLQVAIYEDIPGYKVELQDVTFADAETGHIVAIPADRDEKTDPVWTRGAIVNKVTPVVEYTGDGFTTTTVSYTDAKTYGAIAKENIDFGMPISGLEPYTTANGASYKCVADANDTGVWNAAKTTKENATFSPTVYNVVPVNGVTIADASLADLADSNSGLQFVVNYKLISVDTEETILVKDARVYVPADFTQWAPNTLYTYIFRITKNSSGTTVPGDDTNPVDDPVEPTPCLYPIIFDDVTIEDIHEVDYEFDITELVMSQTSAALNVGDTLNLTVTDVNVPGVVTATWESSNPTAASVDANGTVTANAAGTAVISATVTELKGGITRTYIATCVVTVN